MTVDLVFLHDQDELPIGSRPLFFLLAGNEVYADKVTVVSPGVVQIVIRSGRVTQFLSDLLDGQSFSVVNANTGWSCKAQTRGLRRVLSEVERCIDRALTSSPSPPPAEWDGDWPTPPPPSPGVIAPSPDRKQPATVKLIESRP